MTIKIQTESIVYVKSLIKGTGWRFIVNNNVYFRLDNNSPIKNTLGSIDKYETQVWNDTRVLASDAIKPRDDDGNNPPNVSLRWPQAIGRCSDLLINLLEIAKISDLKRLPDGTKFDKSFILYSNIDEAVLAQFLVRYINWLLSRTHILEDYFPDDYECDRSRFEGMEDVIGYDGEIY